jgi:hypothetical protein
MAVVLGDETGLVTAIESAMGESTGELPGVRPDPDDPNAVIVSWGTGACDDETAVTMQRSGGGLRVGITVNAGFSLGCTAQLVFRGLRVTFSEPVPADSIQVSGGL